MAQHHPPFPTVSGSPGHIQYIYALIALESDAANSRIDALYTAEIKKNKFRSGAPAAKALWEAHCALREQARKQFKDARDGGQLLYAFHGTKAFQAQGGAA